MGSAMGSAMPSLDVMAAPLVSVIIPAFNRQAVIGRAVNSVLSQTVEDLEVIVVDDASTDDTVSVVESIGDSRIRCLRHTENRYAAAARNTGMASARGHFIAFLDSDDEWLPRKLELQLERLNDLDGNWACVYGSARLFKNGSPTPQISRALAEGDLLRKYITSKFVIWTPTFVFRRECLQRVGMMDTSLQRNQDRDFFIRLLQHYKIAVVREPVANIYLDTAKPLARVALRSRQVLLDKHRTLLDELGWATRRRAYASQWMLQAEQFFAEKERLLGLRYFARSVSLYPVMPLRRYAAAVWKLAQSFAPQQ